MSGSALLKNYEINQSINRSINRSINLKKKEIDMKKPIVPF